MTAFWFYVHIAASLGVGVDAHRRGRRFIVWTLLTLIPYGILVTLPLLYILPRLTPLKQTPLAPATPALIDLRPALTPSNKSFYVGVTVWIGVLIILGFGIILK